jgi:hypothetical protein
VDRLPPRGRRVFQVPRARLPAAPDRHVEQATIAAAAVAGRSPPSSRAVGDVVLPHVLGL